MGTWEVCSCEHKEGENWSRTNANAPKPHGIYLVITNSDHYKFLGKQENATYLEEIVMREASKEYLHHCAVIWSSPLTIPRKIASTNNFAVPAVQYQMWSSMWRMEDIRKLDRDTRKLIKNN